MRKYLFLITILFSSVAFAGDTARDQVFVLDNFSKGLDSKTSEFSLPKEKADISENLRYSSKLGSLTKRDNLSVYGTADSTEPILGMHRFYKKNGDKLLIVAHGDEIDKGNDTTGAFTKILDLTTGSHRWQFVTWHDMVIGTDGYNQPIKYDGSSASATYLGSLLATDHGTGSGPAAGAYTYKVGCYSPTYTILLNTPSNTITANGNDVDLSMIPICPDTTLNGEATTGRKIYRTTSNTSTYKLLSNGTVANNTAVTLTDSDADGALGGSMPAGDATWAPPKGRFPIIQNNRLFLANDPNSSPSRLFYSQDGAHDVFEDDAYLDIRQNDGDSITFVKGVLGILTVGKNNTIQKVYIDGDDPVTDWNISDPMSYIGCQAPYSAVNTPLGIFYLTRHGIYRFSGQYSELISDAVTPELKDITDTDFENVWGVYHENIYYMAYSSKAAANSYNDRVLFLDTISNAYGIDLLNINAFSVFNSGDDWGILYAGASDSGKVYAYSSETNEVIHKRFSDFTGLWDDMRYLPEDIGGDSESPVIEIARTETIDELSGTINNQIGVIDRQDTQGYYVSQPISIAANAYDLLSWNETIPVSGGDVVFRLRTSSTGEQNLLYNDDFEFWDNNLVETGVTLHPNDWTVTQTSGTGGRVDSSTTVVQRGTYSAKVTKPNTGNTVLSTIVPNSSFYAGKTMVLDGYIKSANSTTDKVYYQINDGFNTPTTVYYNNGGGWQDVETSTTISTRSTVITIKAVLNSDANAVAYFDQVMFIQGTTAANDWSAWQGNFTDPSGSDISSIPAKQYLQYEIDMSTDDITKTPNVLKQNNFNVKLSYNREGVPQSATIPIHWRSGWMDMGAPNRKKELRWIYVYHEGTAGTLSIKVENLEGDTDTFDINLSEQPTSYKEAFTNGALIGQQFRFEITNNDANPLKINKIVLVYDVDNSVSYT